MKWVIIQALAVGMFQLVGRGFVLLSSRFLVISSNKHGNSSDHCKMARIRMIVIIGVLGILRIGHFF